MYLGRDEDDICEAEISHKTSKEEGKIIDPSVSASKEKGLTLQVQRKIWNIFT